MLFADEYPFFLFFFAQEHHNNTASKKKNNSLKMYLHSYLYGPAFFFLNRLAETLCYEEKTIAIYTFNLCVVCRIFCSPICRTVQRDDVPQTHPLLLQCTNGFKKILACLSKLVTVFL